MTTPTKTDARQLVSRDTLTRTTGAAGSQVDAVLRSLDVAITPPLALSVDSVNSLKVDIASETVVNPSTSLNTVPSPVGGLDLGFTSGSVIFPSASGGTTTVSQGSNITITITSGDFLKVGISVDTSANVVLLAGTQGSTAAAATIPALTSGTLNIGYVLLHNVAGTIQNLTTASIFQYSDPVVNTLTNPMTTAGDMIYGGASGTATRLPNPTATGYMLNSTSSSALGWTLSPTLQGTGAQLNIATDGSFGSVNASAYSSTAANNAMVVLAKSASATIGTSSLVSSTDVLGTIKFLGSNGSSFVPGASIIGLIQGGTPSSTSMPTALTFSTTPAGSTSATERMRIDNSGRLLLAGTTATRTNWGNNVGITPSIQLEGTSSAIGGFYQIGLVNNSNDANGLSIFIGKSRATTVGGSTLVQSGDSLGAIQWQGADGTNMQQAAYIAGMVDTTAASGSMPGRLSLWTTPTSSVTALERVRVDSTGLMTLFYGQINFPATQNASSNVNTLDDYVEGSYTPIFSSGSFTYTNQNGYYVKIGGMVIVNARISYSAITGGSGNIGITLPFSTKADSNYRFVGDVGFDTTFGLSSGDIVAAFGQGSSTTLDMWRNRIGTMTQFTVANMNSSGEVSISCCYRVV